MKSRCSSATSSSTPRARWVAAAGWLVLCLALAGCGYGDVPTLDARARQAWSEVQAQYQRRAELIPRLLETAKAAAGEREIFAEVIASRSRALRASGEIQVLQDPEAFRNFQEAQDRLSAALRRFYAAMDRYPEVKSSSVYAAARAEIETSENRIAVARRDYLEAARAFNAELERVPDRWLAAVFHPDARPFPALIAPPASP